MRLRFWRWLHRLAFRHRNALEPSTWIDTYPSANVGGLTIETSDGRKMLITAKGGGGSGGSKRAVGGTR